MIVMRRDVVMHTGPAVRLWRAARHPLPFLLFAQDTSGSPSSKWARAHFLTPSLFLPPLVFPSSPSLLSDRSRPRRSLLHRLVPSCLSLLHAAFHSLFPSITFPSVLLSSSFPSTHPSLLLSSSTPYTSLLFSLFSPTVSTLAYAALSRFVLSLHHPSLLHISPVPPPSLLPHSSLTPSSLLSPSFHPTPSLLPPSSLLPFPVVSPHERQGAPAALIPSFLFSSPPPFFLSFPSPPLLHPPLLLPSLPSLI